MSPAERSQRAHALLDHWAVRASKELGFPVVVALILLLKMPGWITDAVAGDAKVRAAQHEAQVETTKRIAKSIEASTEAFEQLSMKIDDRLGEMHASTEWIRGVVSGQKNCPPCPPAAAVRRRPSPTPTTVPPPQTYGVATPAPEQRRQ